MNLLGQYIKYGSAGIVGVWLLAHTTMGFTEPLSIEQAVAMALNNHLDIQIAMNTKQQAVYALQSAEGSRGISIDASNSFYLKQVHYPATTNWSDISLSLPLYSGGKNEGNIAIAKTDTTIADLDLLKIKQDVKLNTLTAYYNVINYREIVAVDQETVDNYVKHLENVKAQYSAGNVAKSDVLRSEVEMVDAQQTLLQAKNSYEVAVNTLKKQIRWQRADTPEFVSSFKYVPMDQAMEACIDYAKAHRPDIKKYNLTIDEAKQNVMVAEADKKPSVSLSAVTGWGSSILPSSENNNAYVGVTTSWNVFDSKITDSKIKKAKSQVDYAKLELMSQTDSLELSVKEYYLSMKEAEKRIETTQVSVRKAEEDYFIAEEKYKIGEGILLDVIDAQLALTTAKNNYIAAQYDYATYKAKLENAMGMD